MIKNFNITGSNFKQSYHVCDQIVVKNLRIFYDWWTLGESHLLRLYFGVSTFSGLKITTAL